MISKGVMGIIVFKNKFLNSSMFPLEADKVKRKGKGGKMRKDLDSEP